jgi:uncharacterized protein
MQLLSGMTALHKAVDQYRVNEAVLILLLNAGADVSARTMEGKEALHINATRGQEAILRMLLDRGANVNAQAAEGITPLHLAAFENRSNVVGILLKRGADPKLKTARSYKWTAKGTTPLHLAAQNCSMVESLLKHDAEMEARDDNGETLFFHAASCNAAETVQRLAEFGVDVNTTTHKGDTALHQRSANTRMTGLLLDLGFMVDARNSASETTLHLAAHGCNGALKQLLDY